MVTLLADSRQRKTVFLCDVIIYGTNFASHHHTRDRHVDFLLYSPVLDDTPKCSVTFYFGQTTIRPTTKRQEYLHTHLVEIVLFWYEEQIEQC